MGIKIESRTRKGSTLVLGVRFDLEGEEHVEEFSVPLAQWLSGTKAQRRTRVRNWVANQRMTMSWDKVVASVAEFDGEDLEENE